MPKKAKSTKGISRFYLRYPTKTSAQRISASQKGYFDNLWQYIVVGFEVDNEQEGKRITKGLDQGGIFAIDINEKNKIDALKMRGWNTTVLK